MHCNSRVLGALSAATVTCLSLGLAGTAGATQSATSKYNAAIKAADGESVHYVSQATEPGTSISVVGDTGVSSGKQTLKLSKGSLVENVTVELVGSTGYIKANAPALINILGLTTTQGGTYAGKWLSFPTSNQSLAELVTGLRTSDVGNELKMTGPYVSTGSKTVDGQATVGIRGTVSVSSTATAPVVLYVEQSGTPRPVEEVTNPGKGGKSVRGTVTFSKWGEKVQVVAPNGAKSLVGLLPASAG